MNDALSNTEIGLALNISPRTVQKHLKNVYQRLGVQTRAEVVVHMRQQALRSSA
jgi:DNA-binding CsgD family transcriptional regulator